TAYSSRSRRSTPNRRMGRAKRYPSPVMSDGGLDELSGSAARRMPVEECPGIRAVETPDDHRRQEPWLEVAQVHAVAGAGRGFQRFPVGHDAARPAAHVPQRPITPDVVFRVPGRALDRNGSERVVRPDACRATADRAIATGGLAGREGEREADRPAMAGPVKRWCRLFMAHGASPWFVRLRTPGAAPRSGIGLDDMLAAPAPAVHGDRAVAQRLRGNQTEPSRTSK